MSIDRISRFPIRLSGGNKRDVRTQFAALCWRKAKRGHEVLLITSRDTGRWVTPKGWPMDGKTPAEAAAEEAWEEAGVTGQIGQSAIGVFSYIKPLDSSNLPCLAMVFPLRVTTVHDRWPEQSERTRRWFAPKKAARRVDEDELAQIFLSFDPRSMA